MVWQLSVGNILQPAKTCQARCLRGRLSYVLRVKQSMKTITAIGAGIVGAIVLAACSGQPPRLDSSQPVFDRAPSSAERARLDSVRATLGQQLANGMNFRFTGTASSVLVEQGAPSRIIVGQGNVTQVELVSSARPQFAISVVAPSSRHSDFFQPVEGGGDGPGHGNGTPAPYPTSPPNVGACSAAGGAAWADPSGMGCLGPGSSRPMSCGTWQFLSPGRGRLITTIPGATVEGSWIADNGNGTCGVGA